MILIAEQRLSVEYLGRSNFNCLIIGLLISKLSNSLDLFCFTLYRYKSCGNDGLWHFLLIHKFFKVVFDTKNKIYLHKERHTHVYIRIHTQAYEYIPPYRHMSLQVCVCNTNNETLKKSYNYLKTWKFKKWLIFALNKY